MISRFYYKIWHDWLKLDRPISWTLVNHIHDHLLSWQIAGSLVLSFFWVLLMHFIAMHKN